MNELALFAGAGGGILGGHLLGWRTVCAVEWEPYAACVLAARQNDGLLPPFPIWDDVQTFDGRPWRGIVDVISGGFPCQDISAAGKGAGIDGERSGMWREMARILHEVRPRFVFVENSPMLTSRGLGTVLGDLAAMGFDARWGVLGAADVGAPHQRDRIWIRARQRQIFSHPEYDRDGRWEQQSEGSEEKNVANANSFNDAMRGHGQNNAETMARWGDESRGGFCDSRPRHKKSSRQSSNVDNSNGSHGEGNKCSERTQEEHSNTYSTSKLADTQDKRNVWRDGQLGVVEEKYNHRRSQTDGGGQWWETEPNVGRVADGVAARVDRLKAIGNGQVPLVASAAWKDLNG